MTAMTFSFLIGQWERLSERIFSEKSLKDSACILVKPASHQKTKDTANTAITTYKLKQICIVLSVLRNIVVRQKSLLCLHSLV